MPQRSHTVQVVRTDNGFHPTVFLHLPPIRTAVDCRISRLLSLNVFPSCALCCLFYSASCPIPPSNPPFMWRATGHPLSLVLSGSPAAVADREYGWLRGRRSCFRERILPLYKLMALSSVLRCLLVSLVQRSHRSRLSTFGRIRRWCTCPRKERRPTSLESAHEILLIFPQVGARRIQERTMAKGSSQAPFPDWSS